MTFLAGGFRAWAYDRYYNLLSQTAGWQLGKQEEHAWQHAASLREDPVPAKILHRHCQTAMLQHFLFRAETLLLWCVDSATLKEKQHEVSTAGRRIKLEGHRGCELTSSSPQHRNVEPAGIKLCLRATTNLRSIAARSTTLHHRHILRNDLGVSQAGTEVYRADEGIKGLENNETWHHRQDKYSAACSAPLDQTRSQAEVVVWGGRVTAQPSLVALCRNHS